MCGDDGRVWGCMPRGLDPRWDPKWDLGPGSQAGPTTRGRSQKGWGRCPAVRFVHPKVAWECVVGSGRRGKKIPPDTVS